MHNVSRLATAILTSAVRISVQWRLTQVLHVNLLFRKGVLSLKAGFAYKKGKGDAFEDGTLAKPSDKQNGFPTMDVLMYREYKYLTDPQYSLQLGLKYAFVLPGTKMKTYTAFDSLIGIPTTATLTL